MPSTMHYASAAHAIPKVAPTRQRAGVRKRVPLRGRMEPSPAPTLTIYLRAPNHQSLMNMVRADSDQHSFPLCIHQIQRRKLKLKQNQQTLVRRDFYVTAVNQNRSPCCCYYFYYYKYVGKPALVRREKPNLIFLCYLFVT